MIPRNLSLEIVIKTGLLTVPAGQGRHVYDIEVYVRFTIKHKYKNKDNFKLTKKQRCKVN